MCNCMWGLNLTLRNNIDELVGVPEIKTFHRPGDSIKLMADLLVRSYEHKKPFYRDVVYHAIKDKDYRDIQYHNLRSLLQHVDIANKYEEGSSMRNLISSQVYWLRDEIVRGCFSSHRDPINVLKADIAVMEQSLYL